MRHALATVVLGPLLLVQGRRVRRTVPTLPEPSGQRQGECGGGPALRLLIVGDSAAAGVGARTQDEALAGQLAVSLAPTFRVRWKLLAFTGATTGDMLDHLRREAATDYDAVLTSLGVNDVTGRHSIATWRRQQSELVALLTGRFHAAQILLSGLPPMHRFPALPQPLRWYVGSRARDFDRALEELAGRHARCEFLGLGHEMMDVSAMASDGFHPGPPIYAHWAQEAARRIIHRQSQHAKEPSP